MTAKPPHQFEPWSQLEGKIVMVTGASSGLGFGFCLDLAEAGCKIVAAARRIDRLNSLCAEINKTGPIRAIPVELDVTAEGPSVEACVEKAWHAFGHIDVLINNAGVNEKILWPKMVSLELSEEEWDKVVKTNLRGSWLVSKHTGAWMRKACRGGLIINVSSVLGLNRSQYRNSVAYSSSKSGIDSMTRVMALELGDYNIRVNSIAPALFRAEMTENIFHKSKNMVKSLVEKTVPLRDLGTVNPAITSVIRYLIHDSSTYVTGNVFIVDSGGTLPAFPIFSSL